MSVLFELGKFTDCHYCDLKKPTAGGDVFVGYLGAILWYCSDCLLKNLGRSDGRT